MTRSKAKIWSKLTKEQRATFRLSVTKWVKIVEGSGVDEGGENCPLCSLYTGDLCEAENLGSLCPVADFSGVSECRCTPYIGWIAHHQSDCHSGEDPYRVRCKECLSLARKELRFLMGFLPENERARIVVKPIDLSPPFSQEKARKSGGLL